MNKQKIMTTLKSGFTIVELVVVIAVIGILAAMSVVSYGAWRNTVTSDQLKSDLNGAVSAMESARNFGTGYPITIPLTFQPSSGVTLAGGGSGNGKKFCLSATSGTISYFVTEGGGVPTQGVCPVVLAITPLLVTTTTVDLSWPAISGATSYQLQRATDSGFTLNLITSNGAATSASATGLASNTTYYFRVNATIGGSQGDWSDVVSATTDVWTWDQISVGGNHTCALASGKAYCWGYNAYGQLGNGTTTNSLVSVAVSTSGVLAGKTVTSISAGTYQTCAFASGQAYCWGYNAYGGLGNGTTTNSLVPVAVSTSGVLSGKTVTSISAGTYHTCALAADQAYCWGQNAYGGLGNGITTDSLVPVAVSTSGVLSGKTVTSISAENSQTCALAEDRAYCWGYGNTGQLGNTTWISSSVPVTVSTTGAGTGDLPLATVAGLSSGGNAGHTCALVAGVAYCWGYNAYSQLGNASTTNSSSPRGVYITGVLSGKTVVSVSGGTYHTCAIDTDGQTYCWGRNHYGQLGDASMSNSNVPVAVSTSGVLSGKTVTSIAAGGLHTCALAAGQAYCWGYGVTGELGNGTTTSSSIPVLVSHP